MSTAALADVPGFDEVKSAWRPSEAYLLDSKGEVLHELRVDFTRRRLDWVAIDEMSPALIGMVIQSEDRRFHRHAGVDWWAIGRRRRCLSQRRKRHAGRAPCPCRWRRCWIPSSRRKVIAEVSPKSSCKCARRCDSKSAGRKSKSWKPISISRVFTASSRGSVPRRGSFSGRGPRDCPRRNRRCSRPCSPRPTAAARGSASVPVRLPVSMTTTPRCLELMRLAEGLSDSQRHSRLPVTLAPISPTRGCGIRENGCKRPSMRRLQHTGARSARATARRAALQ